jgi:hypothetical protein
MLREVNFKEKNKKHGTSEVSSPSSQVNAFYSGSNDYASPRTGVIKSQNSKVNAYSSVNNNGASPRTDVISSPQSSQVNAYSPVSNVYGSPKTEVNGTIPVNKKSIIRNST